MSSYIRFRDELLKGPAPFGDSMLTFAVAGAAAEAG